MTLTSLSLAKVKSQTGVDGAAVGSLIVGGIQVGGSAGGITGSADSGGARIGLTLGGQDGETVGGELGARLHVDAGQIPEDGVGGLGVLELEHIGLAGVGGQLDGNTTTVGVGLPGLRVGTAVGSQGLHGANNVGHGPGVDIHVQVVGDQDGATGGDGVVTTNHHAGGQSSSQSGKGSGNAESLGEHHFDREGWGWSKKTVGGYIDRVFW